MYSMVLMAAMVPSGDAAGFGKRNNGCNGGCHGVVAAAGCTGCHGTVAAAGCTGCHGTVAAAGCTGSCHGNSCHGGGFLGLRNRGGCDGNSCNGGGFLGLRGKHKSGGCHGTVSAGCTGTPAGCAGGGIVVVPAAAPEAMPPKK